MEGGISRNSGNLGFLDSSLAAALMNSETRTTSSNSYSKQFLSLPLINNIPNLQSHPHETIDQEMSVKARIMAHPLFPQLLSAYVNCLKVGAPAEVVARLEQVCSAYNSEAAKRSSIRGGGDDHPDAALDQFMEAYCEMLTKYEEELTEPFKEAMLFLSNIDTQLKALTLHSNSSSDSASISSGDFVGQSGSPEEADAIKECSMDPQAEDRELKVQLLRKYSGYMGTLKQEFMKKKNGNLPEEARHQLLDWWCRHYKCPYPSEAQKLALAESTGLDLKQTNNWFINQRKRHWKPSEDVQFILMDPTLHHHHHDPHFYMDNAKCNPFSMDCSSTRL